MADPITLSTMSMAASSGGGVLSAFGAISGGASQKKMYDYQAAMSKINAGIDRQNAEWELVKGDQEGAQYGLKAAQTQGKIRAAQGASGLDVNTGSNADVQRSQKSVTAMDLTTIRNNAAKTAYNYQVKAVQDEDQAKLYEAAGKDAQKAGYLKAASSIIGSAGSVSDKWLKGKQAGIYGGSSSDSNPYYAPLDAPA